MELKNKFAVIIATYKRKNNMTFSYLKKVSNFLKNQTYKNFKIFLIGDNYEDINEFNKITELFSENRIYSYNNPIDVRNGVFNMKINKWCNAGIFAIHYALKNAISEDFNYYLHLDDDDIWEFNHIENINKVINNFPDVDFLVNKSKFMDTFLPKEFININISTYYNNFIPKPSNSVHSSWTVNLKTIGDVLMSSINEYIDGINKIKNKEIEEYKFYPFDANFLIKIKKLQQEKKIKCIFIPECTVTKKSDVNIPN